MTILTKHKGAMSELKASAWLLSQGYEVFRNVSQHGPVDLIALDLETLETKFIDVKTRYKGQSQPNKKLRPEGVWLLEYHPDTDECHLHS